MIFLNLIKFEPIVCNAVVDSIRSFSNNSPARYELTRIVEVLAIGLLARPKACGMGIAAGVAGYLVKCTIQGIKTSTLSIWPILAEYSFVEKESADQDKPFSGFAENVLTLRHHNIIGPIVEEIFNKGTRMFVEWGANKFLETLGTHTFSSGPVKIDAKAIHVFGYQITAKRIAVVVTAVIFVLHHDHYQPREMLAIFPGALARGFLGESEGIIAPIASHMVSNFLGKFSYVLFKELVFMSKRSPS